MVEKDRRRSIVDAKLGDEGEAAGLKIGGEGGSENGGGDGEVLTIRVVKVFCAERKTEPAFRVEVEVEGGAGPGSGVAVFFGCRAADVDGTVEVDAEEIVELISEDQFVLMRSVVQGIASPHIVQEEFKVVGWGIAVLGDRLFIVKTSGRDAAIVARVTDADHEPGLAGSKVGADTGMREDRVAKNVGHAVIAVAGCVQDFITEMCRPGPGGKFQPGGGRVRYIELFDRLDDTVVVIGVFSLAGADAQVGDPIEAVTAVFQAQADHAEVDLVVGAGETGQFVSVGAGEVVAIIKVGGAGGRPLKQEGRHSGSVVWSVLKR